MLFETKGAVKLSLNRRCVKLVGSCPEMAAKAGVVSASIFAWRDRAFVSVRYEKSSTTRHLQSNDFHIKKRCPRLPLFCFFGSPFSW